MLKTATGHPQPLFVAVGSNPARLYGLGAAERAERLATEAQLVSAPALVEGHSAILADLDFAWDPVWLKAMAARPGTVLTLDGRPVLAHVPTAFPADAILRAMRDKAVWTDNGLETLEAETARLTHHPLRTRDRLFVLPLDAADTGPVERAAFDAADTGVTDALTLYVWRRPAFYLTRWAANVGLMPNRVTAVGALLCLLATGLFWQGHYWPGVVAGFAFMVLDTVGGKLARCTGTSSRWGHILDHGINLIHPPLWWWAWAEGLSAYGTPIEPVLSAMLLAAIIGGDGAQRVIERIFVTRFGMSIHVWQRVDSKFRLVTARRNPNMIILIAGLIAGRPDVGLQTVALWTMISLIFHAVRLAQANARRDRDRPVTSWLA